MSKQASEPSGSPTKPEYTDDTPHDVASVVARLFPNYPDEHQIARFFEVLGRAVSAWQLVESSLYLVYERAVRPALPGAAAAAFHSLQAFKTKLVATNAAVRFACIEYDDIRNIWSVLEKRADKLALRRNQFVHFGTVVLVNEANQNDRIRLEPLIYDTRHIVSGSQPRIRITEITEISTRFDALALDLERFSARLAQRLDAKRSE